LYQSGCSCSDVAPTMLLSWLAPEELVEAAVMPSS
jgi:hypothetical protein